MFKIKKAGNKYQVVTEGTGHVHGTHATKREAAAQIKAMYANGAAKDMMPKK